MTLHFAIEEMTNSYTATRLGIDNTPPTEIMPRLLATCVQLEDVRTLLGDNPMRVNSGYRCYELNQAVHGAPASAHMSGYAADFVCHAFGTPAEIVKFLEESELRFDQLILEGTWVHISFDPKMRRQILTAHFTPTGTTYTDGI